MSTMSQRVGLRAGARAFALAAVVAACSGGQTSAGTPPTPAEQTGVQTTVAPAGAATAALTLDPSKVELTSAAYDVFMMNEGRRMRVGSSILTVLKDGATYRMMDQFSAIPLGLEGTSSSMFSTATLSGVSSVEQGTWQGESFASSVHVANGRITGTLQFPDPMGGIKSVKVDVAAPEFLVIDEEVLTVLLVTAELAEGMKAEFSTLDEQSGAIRPLRITVGKPESVTVPAGKFEAFRVRVQTRETSVFHVTVARPRRVVKVTYGSVVELRLAK